MSGKIEFIMSSVDCSSSCGGSYRPSIPNPTPPTFSQPASAVVIPSASAAPPNPLHTLQGAVLQQDVTPPASQVYGSGARYYHQQPTPAVPPSLETPACYSPAERHEDHEEGKEELHASLFARAPLSQLHGPAQVVRYGQASSDNPASYMQASRRPFAGPVNNRSSGRAPVVGMVRYAGMPSAPLVPPVTYGQAVAPSAFVSYGCSASEGAASTVVPLGASKPSSTGPSYGQYAPTPPAQNPYGTDAVFYSP